VLLLAKRSLTGGNINGELSPKRNGHPQLSVLWRIVTVQYIQTLQCSFAFLQHFPIPIKSATAERSFSSLRLLKTYLHSTMKEERLNGLALMNIHKGIHFKYNDVIDQYLMQQNRRLQFE